MNRHLSSLRSILVIGLVWSLVVYLTLLLVPGIRSGHQAFGAVLVLTGALLAFLMTMKQRQRWPSIFFAFIILILFGGINIGTIARIVGTAAVLGWIRFGAREGKKMFLPLIAEGISVAGILAFAAMFNPTSAMVIGLGIWFFYLMQIFPFAATESTYWSASPETLRRQFDDTRRRVRRILAARI